MFSIIRMNIDKLAITSYESCYNASLHTMPPKVEKINGLRSNSLLATLHMINITAST